MKCTIFQESLYKSLSVISHVVPSRPQLPILSTVLLTANKGKIIVVGTDLFTSLGLEISGKIDEEGSVALPARDFVALVGSLSAERIDIAQKGLGVTVKARNSTATIAGVKSDDFPDVWPKKTKTTTLSFPDFSSALHKVLFAAAQDEARPILTGVLFSGRSLLATDGFRLSMASLPADATEFAVPAIVPARMLHEVIRAGSGNTVSLSMTEGGAVAWFDGGWVSGRVLTGTYPDVAKIIPKESETVVTIDRIELERAIRVTSVFAKSAANIVRWSMTNGKLTISANAPQVGEGEVILDVDGKGSGEIAFNSRYLLDWIGSVDSERVEFGMSGPLKPGVFRAAGDPTYTHVIMPVNLHKGEEST